MKSKVTFTLVFNLDGSCNTNASLCNAELAMHEAMVNAAPLASDSEIATAIHAAFDAYEGKGFHLSTDAIVNVAVRNLGEDPVGARKLVSAVKSWLADRCDTDGQDTGKPFVTRRRAGVLRRGATTAIAAE